jgi:hypothetical protein
MHRSADVMQCDTMKRSVVSKYTSLCGGVGGGVEVVCGTAAAKSHYCVICCVVFDVEHAQITGDIKFMVHSVSKTRT